MSGVHTIFDTRRLNKDDDEVAHSAADAKVKAAQMARYYSMSFLAERGEFSLVKGELVAPRR
jgi:hypothetical protein